MSKIKTVLNVVKAFDDLIFYVSELEYFIKYIQ